MDQRDDRIINEMKGSENKPEKKYDVEKKKSDVEKKSNAEYLRQTKIAQVRRAGGRSLV
ncbi:hypothetical protein HanRHA438_Chr13g0584191 [Helianthus annuus]|nr:hypothetical protein HanRHA438_Chr13g0584191 [Helianthus annuus]